MARKRKSWRRQAFLFEEFLVREKAPGALRSNLKPLPPPQRAGAWPLPSEGLRRGAPGADRAGLDSAAAGVHDRVVLLRHGGQLRLRGRALRRFEAMGELALFPAVRKAEPGTLLVADGTSCRHQIEDGTDRQAIHVARAAGAAPAARGRRGRRGLNRADGAGGAGGTIRRAAAK
jgi:hypothetical protein